MTETPAPSVALAGFGKRVGATVLDALLVGLVASAVNLATGLNVASHRDLSTALRASVVVFVLTGIYQVGAIAGWGRTLGNRAVRTEVRRAADLEPPNFGQALLRFLTGAGLAAWSPVTVVAFAYGLLDDLWCLWDGANQTLHDKAARTVVILTDDPVDAS